MSDTRPVQVDTELARIWGLKGIQESQITSSFRGLRSSFETHEERWNGRTVSSATLLERAEAYLASEVGIITTSDGRKLPDYKRSSVVGDLARRQAALDEMEVLDKMARPLSEEFKATRWSRFFLVNNTDGHIHSSMNCSTTRPTTLWSWLPLLSGLTEKDAVDAHGTRLCSACFPTAPVAWTILPPKAKKGAK